MRKLHKKRRCRRASTGAALFAQNDRPDFGRYPRSRGGNPDHAEARGFVEAGVPSVIRIETVVAA